VASLTITGVPDDMIERMRRVAAHNGTSLNDEALVALKRYIAWRFPDQDAVVAMIRAHRDAMDDFVFPLPEK
jgi:hypothetical protein